MESYPKLKFLSLFTYPHVDPNYFGFLYSVGEKCFEESSGFSTMAIQTKMVCRNILRQIHKSTIKNKKQDSKHSIVFFKIEKNTNIKNEWNAIIPTLK